MRKESYYIAFVDPIMALHRNLGQMIVRYSLPIPGYMTEGWFYPDINPYPFMNALTSAYFERKSVALTCIAGNAYPPDCYTSLQGWGVPQIHWDALCRDVFHLIDHAFQSVLPVFPQDDSTSIEFGITENDDVLLWITYYD